jgi:hypothetical protein
VNWKRNSLLYVAVSIGLAAAAASYGSSNTVRLFADMGVFDLSDGSGLKSVQHHGVFSTHHVADLSSLCRFSFLQKTYTRKYITKEHEDDHDSHH